ncbi:hypothetical protein, partial [Rhodoplanes elegans]|uniref:hypothetical protein n=1 Tax=Rhodoplanes elegans TaxID=29408 RepID=UPI001A91CA59
WAVAIDSVTATDAAVTTARARAKLPGLMVPPTMGAAAGRAGLVNACGSQLIFPKTNEKRFFCPGSDREEERPAFRCDAATNGSFFAILPIARSRRTG